MRKRSTTLTSVSLGKSTRIYLKRSSKFQSASLHLGTENQKASSDLLAKGECPQLHTVKFSVLPEKPVTYSLPQATKRYFDSTEMWNKILTIFSHQIFR